MRLISIDRGNVTYVSSPHTFHPSSAPSLSLFPLFLHFPPSLPLHRSQPEISEFVWNSLPVLLGAIEADRPSTTVAATKRGTRRRSDRKRVDHAMALFHSIPPSPLPPMAMSRCSIVAFLPSFSSLEFPSTIATERMAQFCGRSTDKLRELRTKGEGAPRTRKVCGHYLSIAPY